MTVEQFGQRQNSPTASRPSRKAASDARGGGPNPWTLDRERRGWVRREMASERCAGVATPKLLLEAESPSGSRCKKLEEVLASGSEDKGPRTTTKTNEKSKEESPWRNGKEAGTTLRVAHQSALRVVAQW